jgi:hypothetical protein
VMECLVKRIAIEPLQAVHRLQTALVRQIQPRILRSRAQEMLRLHAGTLKPKTDHGL